MGGGNLCAFISNAWGSDDPTRFPGPQPVSIERRHFPLLKRQLYLVCEKTDGVRHLLASTDEGVFLVNRAFSIEKINVRVVWGTDGDAVCLVYGGYNDEGEYIDALTNANVIAALLNAKQSKKD